MIGFSPRLFVISDFLILSLGIRRSDIKEIYADYTLSNGAVQLQDVAFSTKKNRIVAVVDQYGKIILHQSLAGTGKEPKMSEVRPIGTALKPVTNLLKGIIDYDVYSLF